MDQGPIFAENTLKMCPVMGNMNVWFHEIGLHGPAIGLTWTSHSSMRRVHSTRIVV